MKKESRKERTPPTKNLEVRGLREDHVSDGTPQPPPTHHHRFFLCKVNISWPGGENPLLSRPWEWIASVIHCVFLDQDSL